MQKTFVGGEEMTKKVLCRQTSPSQSIEVIENEDYGRVFLLDGLVQKVFFKGLKKCLEPKAVAAGQAGSLRYHNFEIHRAAFALSHFMSRVISKSTLGGEGQ